MTAAMEFETLFTFLHSFWVVWMVAIFIAIILWVFWPSHKKRYEEAGRIPLEDDDS